MADVFISYSKLDRTLAEALAKYLEQAGFIVWWDPQLIGGESFREAIDKQLDAARAVIVIWTPNSIISQWVIAEADHAGKKGNLIPVRIGELAADLVPKPFTQLQTTLVDNRPAVVAALKRLNVEPRYAPGADGSLHDKFWKEIEHSDNIKFYELYLKEFPEGPQNAFARLKIAMLQEAGAAKANANTTGRVASGGGARAWGAMRAAKALSTIIVLGALSAAIYAGSRVATEFGRELSQLRESLSQTAAAVDAPRLADDADWQKTEAVGLVSAWRSYLRRRPIGNHADEAEARIDQRLTLNQRLIAKIDGHDKPVMSIEFEAGRMRGSSRDVDGKVQIWNPASGKVERQSRGDKPLAKTDILAPADAPDMGIDFKGWKLYKSGSYSLTLANGAYKTELPGSYGDKSFSVPWSDIAHFIVRFRSKIYLVSSETPRVTELALPASDFGKSVTAKVAASRLLVSIDQTVYVVRRSDGALLATLENHVAPVRALAFSDDGLIAASGGDDRTVRIWDLSDIAQ